MTAPALPPSALDVIDLDVYQRGGYPHDAWARLRADAPIARIEHPDFEPFWAVTKHADIVTLSKQPKFLRNSPRMAVLPRSDPAAGPEPQVRQLLNMDPPDHGAYRLVASSWFTPRAIQRLAPSVEALTTELLDAWGSSGESDFVADITAPLTLSVLAEMLGVPREDWRLMFDWTNQVAGSADPEFHEVEGEAPLQVVERARTSLFSYFAKLIEERRANAKDDMVSVIGNGKVRGQPIPPLETLSYCFVLVIAGNETTRNAASGGLLDLIQNPDEFEKLKENPDLVDLAVEEIVRRTSPVIQFCRTPDADFEIRGQKIPAGDNLCLFYPSANRDEEVFEEADAFRIDRDPNPHLGFGIGEHFCLGANLARLELRALFRQLAERVDTIELAGPVERVRSSFLGGVKRMPIAYRMR